MSRFKAAVSLVLQDFLHLCRTPLRPSRFVIAVMLLPSYLAMVVDCNVQRGGSLVGGSNLTTMLQ